MVGRLAAPRHLRRLAQRVEVGKHFGKVDQPVRLAVADGEDEADREGVGGNVAHQFARRFVLDLRGGDHGLDRRRLDGRLDLRLGPVDRQRRHHEAGLQRGEQDDGRVGARRQMDAEHHVRPQADGGEKGGEAIDALFRLGEAVLGGQAGHRADADILEDDRLGRHDGGATQQLDERHVAPDTGGDVGFGSLFGRQDHRAFPCLRSGSVTWRQDLASAHQADG